MLRLVKRATDGCVNVFVDAGANTGAHTRILFEPKRHAESGFLKIFDKIFGADRRLNHAAGLHRGAPRREVRPPGERGARRAAPRDRSALAS